MAGLGDIYTNIDEFESTPGAVLGLDWNSEDLGYLALENKIVTPIADCTVEIHLYTPGNNPEYITGGVIPQEHYQLRLIDHLFLRKKIVSKNHHKTRF